MKIVKRGSSYAVEGSGDGWLFNRTYPARWKAKLAIEVFKKGGRVSDYWREAREEADARRYPDEKRLRLLVESEPENADLRFELALELYSSSTLTFFKGEYWAEWHVWAIFGEKRAQEAKEQLMVALAIGLSDPLSAAKARFLLAELILSDAKTHLENALDKHPELKTLANGILSDTKKHLRRHPYCIEALNLQKSAYVLLGNQEGVGRIKLALAQAHSLREAGLASEQSSLAAQKVRGRRKDGIELEQTAAKLLSTLGLQASTTNVTGDGGIDVVAYSESPIFAGKYIIQCKDWANPVGEPVVRDLFGVILSEGANKGIIITTGEFTSAARRFAEGKPIELIDGDGLRELLNRHDVQSVPSNE
jgi:hypothetical protein